MSELQCVGGNECDEVMRIRTITSRILHFSLFLSSELESFRIHMKLYESFLEFEHVLSQKSRSSVIDKRLVQIFSFPNTSENLNLSRNMNALFRPLVLQIVIVNYY